MGIYFIIFGILAFFSLLEVFALQKIHGVIIFVVFSFFLYLLSFLRWETGTDWGAYVGFFNRSTDWFYDSEFEWGFSRIVEFFKINFDNYTVLLFFLASVLFGFQSKAILKFSPYPLTSLFVLWSVSFGNIFFIRQTIATVILLYSVRFIQERKFFKFLLMIAFAMLFHRTSIIFIFAWFVYNLRLRPVVLIICVIASIFISVVIGRLMESLGGLVGGVIQQKLDFYLSDSEMTFGAESSLAQIIIRGFANKIFIFGISIFYLEKVVNKEPKFIGYLNIYWAGIILYFSTISISVALIRLSFAYDIILIIIVPMILQYIKKDYLRFFVFLLFVIYLAARLYISITGSFYDSFVPFKTIFS